MRCFIAIDVDMGLFDEIKKLQADLENYDVKLVEPHNLHFTMKFLGDIEKSAIEKVKERLESVVKSTIQFEISLHGVGVFPSMNYIKVIWVGDENKGLYNLQNAIEEGLSDMFKKEKPSPHLTIARVRTPINKKEISGFVEKNKHIWLGKMLVKEIKLKRSYLGSKGPKYEDLATFGLSA